MINEDEALAIARSCAEENGWGFPQPVHVGKVKTWFSRKLIRYDVIAGFVYRDTAPAKFAIDAETGEVGTSNLSGVHYRVFVWSAKKQHDRHS